MTTHEEHEERQDASRAQAVENLRRIADEIEAGVACRTYDVKHHTHPVIDKHGVAIRRPNGWQTHSITYRPLDPQLEEKEN